MSIAEKLVKIAENEPKVYEAGKVGAIQNIEPASIDTSVFKDKLQTIANNTLAVYEAGRNLAEQLKCTASGEVIRVDNVSPIEHELTVRLTETEPSTPFINVESMTLIQGSNTLDYELPVGDITVSFDTTGNIGLVEVVSTGGSAYSGELGKGGTHQTYTLRVPDEDTTYKLNIYAEEETTIENLSVALIRDFSGVTVRRYGKNLCSINSVTYPLATNPVVFEEKVTGEFVFSADVNLTGITYDGGAVAKIDLEDGTVKYATQYSARRGVLINGTVVKIQLVNYCKATGGSLDNIQLEAGTTATEYEPYKESQIVTANSDYSDGTVTGLTSVSPTMTLLTDTDGVTINLEYYGTEE